MKPLEALRALGTGSDAPAEAKQRVYGALLASLQIAPTSSAGLLDTTPSNVGSAASSVTVSTKLMTIAAAIWLVGGVTGALLYGALRPVPTRVVYIERPPAVSAQPPLPVELRAPASAEPSRDVTEPRPNAASPRAGASSSAGARASSASDLARERALLDLARNAASRAEPATVLALVDQHRASFPHGRLSEEREALAIRALLALGQRDRARARADAFRATFPGSFLLPMLDSALANP